MVRHSLVLLLLAAPVIAQQPRQLTAQDYARAERFLGANAAPLVTGIGVRPTWLADGRFWYRTSVPAVRRGSTASGRQQPISMHRWVEPVDVDTSGL